MTNSSRNNLKNPAESTETVEKACVGITDNIWPHETQLTPAGHLSVARPGSVHARYYALTTASKTSSVAEIRPECQDIREKRY